MQREQSHRLRHLVELGQFDDEPERHDGFEVVGHMVSPSTDEETEESTDDSRH